MWLLIDYKQALTRGEYLSNWSKGDEVLKIDDRKIK